MATKKSKPAAKQPRPGANKGAQVDRIGKFVEAYIANGQNGRKAALAAGYSEGNADVQAWRMLKNAKVVQQIAMRQQSLARKYELTTDSVIRSLAQAVHFDPRKLYREDGSLKDVYELDDDTAMALSGVEVVEEKGTGDDRGKVVGYTKKLKWLDKNAAREQAMKHLGLYLEDNKQKHPLSEMSDEQLSKYIELKAREAGVTLH